MGKGKRAAGKQHTQLGYDLFKDTADFAGRASDFYWGGPTASYNTGYSGGMGEPAITNAPVQYGSAQPRQRKPGQPRVNPKKRGQPGVSRRHPSGGQPDYTGQGGVPGTGGGLPPGTPTLPDGSPDYEGIVRGLVGNRPLTTETMLAIEPDLAQYGLSFRWNADHTRPDIVLPDGTQIDFVGNMGGANPTWQWDVVTPGHGGGPTGGPSGGEGGYGVSGPGAGGIPGMTVDNYLDLMNRWGEFAETGGYSPETLDAIRSRALSPVRAAYSDALREVDRSRALQGGYAPNVPAVRARMAREQSQAASDAATGAEAGIGQMVQQGRLQGLGGMSSLYGTTPGLASTFGNQALQAQALRNQLFSMLGGGGGGEGGGFPWASVVGAVAPWLFALSSKKYKTDVKPTKGILRRLKKLPINEWKYKGDEVIHVGPMAEDFHREFGGKGDMLYLPDVLGVTLGAVKELAERDG